MGIRTEFGQEKEEYEQKLDMKKRNTNRNWTGKVEYEQKLDRKMGIWTEIGFKKGNTNRNWTWKRRRKGNVKRIMNKKGGKCVLGKMCVNE